MNSTKRFLRRPSTDTASEGCGATLSGGHLSPAAIVIATTFIRLAYILSSVFCRTRHGYAKKGPELLDELDDETLDSDWLELLDELDETLDSDWLLDDELELLDSSNVSG